MIASVLLRQTAPNTVQYAPSKPLTNWKSIDAECPVQHLLAQSRGRRLTSGSRFWPRALAVPSRRVWGPLLRACASDPWLTLSLAVSSWNRAGPEARSPRGNRRLKGVACSSSRRRSSRLSTQAQASHPQSRMSGPQTTAKSCELVLIQQLLKRWPRANGTRPCWQLRCLSSSSQSPVAACSI